MVEHLNDDETQLKVRTSALSFYDTYMKRIEIDKGIWPAEFESLSFNKARRVLVRFEDMHKVKLFCVWLIFFY